MPHLHIRAEEKSTDDGARTITAVCPNSLEHSRILSKFAQTAFVGLVDAFWSRRRCVPSESSRTYFRAEESRTPATAEMRYKPSSTILRPLTPDTSETPSELRRGSPSRCHCIAMGSPRICRTALSLYICPKFLGAGIVMGPRFTQILNPRSLEKLEI